MDQEYLNAVLFGGLIERHDISHLQGCYANMAIFAQQTGELISLKHGSS